LGKLGGKNRRVLRWSVARQCWLYQDWVPCGTKEWLAVQGSVAHRNKSEKIQDITHYHHEEETENDPKDCCGGGGQG
jgi:hypothetical protein